MRLLASAVAVVHQIPADAVAAEEAGGSAANALANLASADRLGASREHRQGESNRGSAASAKDEAGAEGALPLLISLLRAARSAEVRRIDVLAFLTIMTDMEQCTSFHSQFHHCTGAFRCG